MGISWRRICLAALLTFAGLSLWQPRAAQAHPQFVGRWSAQSPPGEILAYEFGPAQYITNGVWRGSFNLYVSGYLITCGTYELRMLLGAQGTVGLKDGACIGTRVGIVDLGARTMLFKELTFRP